MNIYCIHKSANKTVHIFIWMKTHSFLQDSRQPQLVLPYTDTEENGKLVDLAKLYSLNIQVEDGRATFTKTM